MSDIAANLAALRARIGPDVTLVVVTKSVGAEEAALVLDAGVVDLGENRAQQLLAKADALQAHDPPPRWHFIGRLQRNKVRAIARRVALWQSVDRVELVEAIARHAPGASVLVQVSLAGESQKGGCEPDEAARLVDAGRSAGLDVRGLMTVPPLAGDPRPVFAALRRLTDDLDLAVCSMGMSGDFEAAVAEGATMVRIGSAVFSGVTREPG